MQQNDIDFLKDSFKRYYFEHFDLIRTPEKASEREFGFQKFDSGMIRHIQLRDDRELRLLLMQNVPSDVYCSNAYYSFPRMPMNEKDWKGADLIFDIDAKDLKLDCRKDHTVMLCNACSHISAYGTKCARCNSARLESKSLPCSNCITASKTQTRNLITILTCDFAIAPTDIKVYFSGNEGFHVHVRSLPFLHNGSRERADLVDYIMFHGAMPDAFGMKRSNPTKDDFPDFGESGWRGRFAKEMFGSKTARPKIAKALLKDGYQPFQKTLNDLSGRMGVRIDSSVTMDVHRIFRLPGSLNSKSGLAKTLCRDLDSFNPYKEASFLSGDTVEVHADCPYKFRLGNKKFGPYTNETATVPAFAAAYMICKKLASVC